MNDIWHLPEKTRSVEVYLGLVALMYGVILLLPGETFSHPAYSTLREILSERTAGILFVLFGVVRVAAVLVNGYWRPNAVIRLACCIWGSFTWMSLAFMFLQSSIDYVPAMLAFLLPAVLLETFASASCARDAYQQNSFGLRHHVRSGWRSS